METNQKVLAFIQKHPEATKEQIAIKTGVKSIQLYNVLRKLTTDNLIIEEEKDGNRVYTSVESNTTEKPKIEAKAESVESKGRDNSKMKFNNELYGKGPLVRAVVTQYVTDNPSTTYKQLKEVFPDDLLQRFGIFQDVETARKIAPNGKRYFDKPEQLIKLKDKKVVVCNQFTLANIQPFLKVAKGLGYKIK